MGSYIAALVFRVRVSTTGTIRSWSGNMRPNWITIFLVERPAVRIPETAYHETVLS